MQKHTRVTAKDVARLADVSTSTVSRVLSGKGADLIGADTAERVRSAASTLGYSPDPIARALRGEQTFLLGLIVREIADPFFASFVSTLNSQARALGYQILLSHAHSDPKEALQVAAVLDARHCDGVLVLGDLRDDEAAFQTLLQREKAIVGLCRGHAPGSLYTVNSDNELGVRMLFEHLWSLGHRRIAYLDGGWLGDIRERRDAFLAVSAEKGVTPPNGSIRVVNSDMAGGKRGAVELLGLTERPTAIMASDDAMAIGALRAVLEAGLQVPGDVSIVGFDDIDASAYTVPALTTVRQSIDEMSRQALRLLIGLIATENRPEPGTLIRVKPELVVRESAGSARVP
jgi:DNA-binding LacI/PurR family transcriptional regulator